MLSRRRLPFRSPAPWAIPAVVCLLSAAWAQTTPPPRTAASGEDLDRKVLAAASQGSEALANLTYLCDVIGPRLTGSANLKRANEWAAAKMKSYGLENVHQEPWSLPEGWERGTATARVLEPDNGRVLTVASAGWSPGTAGRVQGDVIAFAPKTSQDLAAFKGKLKGAIVLDGLPTKLRPLDEVFRPGGPPKAPAFPKKGGRPSEEVRAFLKERSEFLHKEGAAVVLRDAGKHFGLLYTTGGWRGQDRPSASNRLPTLYVAHNHYEMLHRLAARSGRTRVEVEVSNKFIPGPLTVWNTVGEIRGSEKPDEYVVVAAHLDSWDLGQGATDNGTGTTAVLEAARILARSGIQPRRTIRFILFTGEEQGLHGSRAYLERHKAELPRISACVVHDTGQGKVIGVSAAGRPGARAVLETELAGLRELGVTDFAGRSGGGSDHASFEAKGVPGFILRQDVADYFSFSHHSQADTLDRASAANLTQGAQVLAVTALRIANLDALLPRDKARPVAAGEEKKPAEQVKGQRVFSCGHSFHYFVPPILSDLAKKGGIEGHEAVGLSAIGGSRVYQHWNVPDAKNKAKAALRAGKVDVLTLSPIHLPDDGIEKFVKLACEHNPKVRVTVQEFWLPFDIYDTTFTKRPKEVDHDAPTGADLRKLHEPYFKSMDEHVRGLRKEYGKETVFVVPVGQAVIALREKIIAGKAPGLKKQSDLFTDPIGHAKAPLMALVAYCHYAVIYRRSPVGLPLPAVLANAKNADWGEPLNRLLQELAWDAVTRHPLSGVAAAKPR